MTYSSSVFIFYVAFALFFFSLLPRAWKIYGLYTISMLWYSSWGWPAVLTLIAISAFNFFLLRIVKNKNTFFYSCLVVFNMIVFILFKSFQPIYGLSFFYLTLLGLIIDLWRNKTQEFHKGLVEFALFPSFFATLMAGPILRQDQFFPQLRQWFKVLWTDVVDGTLIFSYGFVKKNTVGHFLSQFEDNLLKTQGMGIGNFILFGLVATFRAYIDFSSYCDMGRGIAYCFGIKLVPNFTPFYYSRNPSEFWQRWNITLGTWIRDYVSFPLMLRWGRHLSQPLILMLSFILVGLWHGISWNWFLFGVFNGLLIVSFASLQRLFSRRSYILAMSGMFFVLLLYIGNGVLQNSQSLELFKRISLAEAWFDFSVFNTTLGLFYCLPILLIIEFFQEKKKNLDFYLAASIRWKQIAFAVTIGLFLLLLHQNFLLEEPLLPPLYFRF